MEGKQMTPEELRDLYLKMLWQQHRFTQQALAWPVDENGRAIEKPEDVPRQDQPRVATSRRPSPAPEDLRQS